MWTWATFPEYLDFVEATPKGINYAGYLGHSALRTWAMGEAAFDRGANADELALMLQQLRDSLHAGAIGFTTSISYNHETADDRPWPRAWRNGQRSMRWSARWAGWVPAYSSWPTTATCARATPSAMTPMSPSSSSWGPAPASRSPTACWPPPARTTTGSRCSSCSTASTQPAAFRGARRTLAAWAPCCRSRPRCRSMRCRCGVRCGRTRGASSGLRCEIPRCGDASSTRPRTATTAERSVRRPASRSGSTSTR